MKHPTREQIDTASDLLADLAVLHGLTNLRHGPRSGTLVVDVSDDRDYSDIVSFMDDVEGRVGFRPEVIASGAPAAEAGRAVGDRTSHVA